MSRASDFNYADEMEQLQVRLAHVAVPAGAGAQRWTASWADDDDATRTIEWSHHDTSLAGITVAGVQDVAGQVAGPHVSVFPHPSPVWEISSAEARELAAALSAAADALDTITGTRRAR